MLKTVDSFHIHPKNKLLLYHSYIPFKLSWHLTVADLSKTWICEHLDNAFANYILQWLELPLSAILSAIILSHNNFDLSFQPPSVKLMQCQAALCSSLKSSQDDVIRKLWKSNKCGISIQDATYKSTKHVLRIICAAHAEKLQSKLIFQGFIISFLLEKSLKRLNSLLSKPQSSFPTKIFNFTIRYLHNTLANENSKRGSLPLHLIALSALSPSHSSMLLLDANRI